MINLFERRKIKVVMIHNQTIQEIIPNPKLTDRSIIITDHPNMVSELKNSNLYSNNLDILGAIGVSVGRTTDGQVVYRMQPVTKPKFKKFSSKLDIDRMNPRKFFTMHIELASYSKDPHLWFFYDYDSLYNYVYNDKNKDHSAIIEACFYLYQFNGSLGNIFFDINKNLKIINYNDINK